MSTDSALGDWAHVTYYDDFGGHETFVKLVREFYRGVAQDEPLRALYPDDDLGLTPRSGCGCSSSSTGADRRPTRNNAATPGCGCATCRMP